MFRQPGFTRSTAQVEQPLDTLDHPVITKAQHVPEEVAAHGAERVLLTRDRVWFKVKIGTDRAVVTELDRASEERAEIAEAGAWWWIGAAGKRKQDSTTDFYTSLEAECARAGKGTGTGSSTHLLPTDIDIRFLSATGRWRLSSSSEPLSALGVVDGDRRTAGARLGVPQRRLPTRFTGRSPTRSGG